MAVPKITAAVAAGLVLLVSSGAFAQQGTTYRRRPHLYDPNHVETLRGTVARFESVEGIGIGVGVVLVLETGDEEVQVGLGPNWFVGAQNPKIAVRDDVEVLGSRVVLDGKTQFIAAEVRRGEEVLKLRHADGVPLWRSRVDGKAYPSPM